MLADQKTTLLALAAGHRRTPDIDRDYQERDVRLCHGLAQLGLANPFPHTTAAWIAECRLRPVEQQELEARLQRLIAPLRQALSGASNTSSR